MVSVTTPYTGAQRALFDEHLPLVRRLVASKRCRNCLRRMGWDAAYSSACWGLLRATTKPHATPDFVTYAVRRMFVQIRHDMLREEWQRRRVALCGVAVPADLCRRSTTDYYTPYDRAASADQVRAILDRLTPGEVEVMCLTAAGWTGDEIADRLGCSPRKVDATVRQARSRFCPQLALRPAAVRILALFRSDSSGRAVRKRADLGRQSYRTAVDGLMAAGYLRRLGHDRYEAVDQPAA